MHRVFLGITVALQLGLVAAQTTQSRHAQHGAPLTRGQVIADGRIAPEQIPDELALKHLLIHLSAPGTPTYQNAEAKARRIGLGAADLQALSRGVDAFRNTFTQLQAKLSIVKPASPTVPAQTAAKHAALAINDEMMTLVNQTHAVIVSELSSEGRKKFADYLAHVKTRVVIIAPPRM
jgi:hypothetical protein